MLYAAIRNTPGYLPENQDPPLFATAEEAWWYHYHERIEEEDDLGTCMLCGQPLDNGNHGVTGDCDDDTEEALAIGKMARTKQPGVIVLPTPSLEHDLHDLGIAYSVVAVDDQGGAL